MSKRSTANADFHARSVLLRALHDHDAAAKVAMRQATAHLKRGRELARELETIEAADERGASESCHDPA